MTKLTPNGRGLGRKKDGADRRDRLFGAVHPEALATPLPVSIDLRSQLPACWNQLQTSSCGPHAGDGLMCFLFPEIVAQFSRLQIYYDARVIEEDVNQDDGVETRDILVTLQKLGAAPETMWPFDVAQLFTQPPTPVFDASLQYTLAVYSRLSSSADMLGCLASKFPFILGFQVPQELDSAAVAASGVLPLPVLPLLNDGHDVLIVGYDQDFLNNPDFIKSGLDPKSVDSTALLVRNSWGADWGINGHFWMPFSIATDQTAGNDAWTGRRVPATQGAAVMPTPDTAATDPDMLATGRNAVRGAIAGITYMGFSVSDHITDDQIDAVVIAVDNALTAYRNAPSI